MTTVNTIFDSFLVSASSYALYCMPPNDYPFAFSACAFGLCHGLLGMIQGLNSEGNEQCNKVKEISNSVMEIIQVPLINIELYRASSESSALALGHGLFIIPLAFDLIAKLFTEEGEDSNTNTLKDLTILGNVVSLAFLAVNEGNYIYANMALVAFLTKYGSALIESYFETRGEGGVLLGYTWFTSLTNYALTESIFPGLSKE